MALEFLDGVKLFFIVFGIIFLFNKSFSKPLTRFLPTPFWIYFIPIVLSSMAVLPNKSAVYDFFGLHFLPAALVLLLIGTPMSSLFKIGPKALWAVLIGMVSMFIGVIMAYLLLGSFMPEDSWRAAGALLGTWTGGSANLLAVKEMVNMPDAQLAPLIIVDTCLSYGWLAFLIFGAAYQTRFDQGMRTPMEKIQFQDKPTATPKLTFSSLILILMFGFLIAELSIWMGKGFSIKLEFLSQKAWAILIASLSSVGLALTPLRKLEEKGASLVGTFILYLVLASIGAKTNVSNFLEAPIFLLFGLVIFLIHGSVLLGLGRWLKIPLHLLATASQANVGGPVSAPIVAGVYKPGTSHFGVLMAILVGILGTYIGLAGAYLCRGIETWLR